MSSWIKSWKRFTIRVAKQQPSTATKNLLLGANVAGFEKVAKAMAAEGLV